MVYIDSHCHIDWFSDEELEIIAQEANIIYAVGISYESSLRVLKICNRFKNIKAALGIHPEYFEHYKDFKKIKELIYQNSKNIYAIGEVGLPYFSLLDKNISERKMYYDKGLLMLEEFIVVAKDLNLPLVLHCTQSTAIDAYGLLKKYNIKKALFHWLYCDMDTAKLIFEEGYCVSASLDIIYNEPYFDFVKNIPLKNLLLESDSPWEYNSNAKSRPKDIQVISKILASHYNLDEKSFLHEINCNSENLFGINKK